MRLIVAVLIALACVSIIGFTIVELMVYVFTGAGFLKLDLPRFLGLVFLNVFAVAGIMFAALIAEDA